MKELSDNDLTVVIPTWNRAELLRRCLESLRLQSVPCRVLVVDDGSTDGTQRMLRDRFPEIDCVRLEAKGGFARAANVGIRWSSTRFVALLNNDTEADQHWVEAGLSAFREFPQYWIFASKMIDHRRRNLLDSAGDCYDRGGLAFKRGAGQPADRYPLPEPVLGASAGAAFYRRSLFERVGFFDESFHMYLEDVDLCLRAQWVGLPCMYLPRAVVYHFEAASDPDRRLESLYEETGRFYSRARVYWITRNRWQLMITYQPFRNLPWLLLGWLRSLAFHLLKAGFTGSFLRGVLSGVSCTPRAIHKRLSLRRERTISTRQICMLLRQC